MSDTACGGAGVTGGMVPRRVRMKVGVQGASAKLHKGDEYDCLFRFEGQVSALTPGGPLGLLPHEYEVVAWQDQASARPGDGLEPSEGKMTHYRIWRRSDCPEGAFESFGPFPGADAYAVVGVPVGWSLAPHARYGAVLVSCRARPPESIEVERDPDDRPFVTADQARLYANARQDGFKLVADVALPRPLDDVRDVPRAALNRNIPDKTRWP